MIALGRLFGVPLRMHFALLVMAAAALMFEKSGALLCGLLALLLHEAGHAAAARACGCTLGSIELTPFGGVAAYDGSSLSPRQEAVVALAGPAASLAGAAVAVAAKQWMLAAANAALLLVNLLPVLPLDGGRALRAFLFPRVSRSKVTAILCYAGAAAGVLLSALGVYAAVRGSLNPTLFLAGAYLSRQALRERETPALLSVRALHGRQDRMRKAGVRPVRWLAAVDGTPMRHLAARMPGGEYCMVLLVDERMRVRETLSETDVLQRCLGENP